MTKIKLCGLFRPCDIETANRLMPEFIGFVFAPRSRRYVSPETAAGLKEKLDGSINAVGVFVDERAENISALLENSTIDMAQLHGGEDEEYIDRLRKLTDKPIIKAFAVRTDIDIEKANKCGADYVLLDSGAGTGTVFDWRLIENIERPFFLAGGLDPDNVCEAIKALNPYAVDVSSGIETDCLKDKNKMAAFVAAVRKEESI